ncbi:hypothetical protein GTP91_10955 [Rugamonas sp. FT82W]|uniref:Uncharacterized protein n=1 Tax=Duganella vulcania TaxID=2692166 RepID=A0A845G486_9BURK|nr:hypothetical protein [Duganella vulcania]MYM87699.1 hypothetical protein [Duganella vulcania]
MDGIDAHPTHWRQLGVELKRRTTMPLEHPSFVFFFLVAILIVGPIGVWVELYGYITRIPPNAAPLRSSFTSFVPAFLAATCMQLIWAEDQRKSLRAFSILILAVCTVGLLFCNSRDFADGRAIFLGFILVALSMWMWWVANANQKEFMDSNNQFMTNPIGGENVDGPLQGNLDGFNTD